MTSRDKYFKYKQKFLNLKNQAGGCNDVQTVQNLEPVAAKFIKSLEGSPPIYTLPIDEARKTLNQAAISPEKIDTYINDITIANNISIRIVKPLNSENIKLPIVMYFHGGGWVLGNKETHDRLIRQIAIGARVAVVFVNYTPAPEAKFPTQINQAYDATLYMYNNANKFNLDANKMIIVGDSVGGNMSIAVALMAKQRNIPKIQYQILLYPVTCTSLETESYKKFENGPWLTKKAMAWFFDQYLSNPDDKNNILVAPIKATIDQLRNLPPTLIITDENDVLRDEGEAFAHKLMNADVDVTAVRFLGTTHDFLILNAIKDTPAVKNAISLIINKVKDIIKL